MKDFRQKLQRIGIYNGRILDIHYPARGVMALLIHHSYEVELEAILTKFQISPVADFNPTAAVHVNDPALGHLTVAELSTKAVEFHQNCLIRGLKLIRGHLRRSVARDFVKRDGLLTIKLNLRYQKLILLINSISLPKINSVNLARTQPTALNFNVALDQADSTMHKDTSNTTEDEHMDIDDETSKKSLPGAAQPAPRQ